MSFTWFAKTPLRTREQVAAEVHAVSLDRGLDQLATVLCCRTPGLAMATKATCPEVSAARGAIQPAALAPRKPTWSGSIPEYERAALTGTVKGQNVVTAFQRATGNDKE